MEQLTYLYLDGADDGAAPSAVLVRAPRLRAAGRGLHDATAAVDVRRAAHRGAEVHISLYPPGPRHCLVHVVDVDATGGVVRGRALLAVPQPDCAPSAD